MKETGRRKTNSETGGGEVGGGGRIPAYASPYPWWPYYPAVYSPSLAPWVDLGIMVGAEHERWSARRHQCGGDSPCGSVWEYPMGEGLGAPYGPPSCHH